MASGATGTYGLPYPVQTDPVDVATDIQGLATQVETQLLLKAPIASPTFTGTPSLAVTPSNSDNSTQIATTAFVKNQSYLTTTTAASTYAPIASPTFTGIVSISNNDLSMGNALGDRITVYGTHDSSTAYAIGIESNTMYYKSNSIHRWYIGVNADGGTSEKLELTTTGLISVVPVLVPAATTSAPSLRIPHGTAPSAPTNGDVWTTTVGMYARINGNTVGPFGTGATYTNTTPTAITGALWANSDYNSLSVYTGTRWASMTGTYIPPANTKTTTYQLVLGDEGGAILMNGSVAGTNNITVPTNSVAAFPIGSSIIIVQTSAVQTVISGAGVTFYATPGLKLRAQYSVATLLKVATDVWVVTGDLIA